MKPKLRQSFLWSRLKKPSILLHSRRACDGQWARGSLQGAGLFKNHILTEESSIRRKNVFWEEETLPGPSWQIVIWERAA